MKRWVWLVAPLSFAAAACAEEGLSPPAGTTLLFSAEADGVQIYSCLPKDPSGKDPTYAWTFTAPQAALFDAQGRQIGSHGKGPTWTLADGSSATAELVSRQAAPQKGSIPWLLLRVTAHEGTGRLGGVVAIRRVDTKGGAEPGEGCDGSHMGALARVRYSATYQFFGF